MRYEPDGDGEEGGEYQPEEDGPEARFAREQLYIEERELRCINRFLDSLRAGDSRIELFTFQQQKEWGIPKNHRVPPKT